VSHFSETDNILPKIFFLESKTYKNALEFVPVFSYHSQNDCLFELKIKK